MSFLHVLRVTILHDTKDLYFRMLSLTYQQCLATFLFEQLCLQLFTRKFHNWTHILAFLMVPLNYSHVWTRMYGTTQNFVWKYVKFSTRQDVVSPMEFMQHETYQAWTSMENHETYHTWKIHARFTLHGQSMQEFIRIITDMTSYNMIVLVSE